MEKKKSSSNKLGNHTSCLVDDFQKIYYLSGKRCHTRVAWSIKLQGRSATTIIWNLLIDISNKSPMIRTHPSPITALPLVTVLLATNATQVHFMLFYFSIN